jgi:hypothetical protein
MTLLSGKFKSYYTTLGYHYAKDEDAIVQGAAKKPLNMLFQELHKRASAADQKSKD